jgi:hypothetical protein
MAVQQLSFKKLVSFQARRFNQKQALMLRSIRDDTIVCSGASWTLTLYDPTTGAGNKGKRLKIVHNGTLGQVYTLATTGGTIGGIASLSYALYTPGEMIEIQSDGSANWVIINRKTRLGGTKQRRFIRERYFGLCFYGNGGQRYSRCDL